MARATGSALNFSGVALADILANGVAIIVIMIVVTLMVRHEKEQEKLEQAEDIAVLLSREIASSLVMNSLPTSAPAVLHDYVNSPLDRNPTHARMPIIELHDDFIRDYYSGRIYRRNELLKYDNAFDTYIKELSDEQLSAMRIDVYSIAQFYIVMSILKGYGHRPRHWHFLEELPEHLTHLTAPGATREDVFQSKKTYDDSEWKQSLSKHLSGRKNADRSLPEDVTISPLNNSDQLLGHHLPFTQDGLFSQRWQDYIGLPPVRKEIEPGEGWSDFYSYNPGNPTRRKQKIFRTALQPLNQIILSLQGQQNLDNFILARAYFAFMADLQEKTDRGLPADLHTFNFIRHILGQIPNLPRQLSEEDRAFFSDLAYWLSSPLYTDDQTVVIELENNAAVSGQVLKLPVNVPVQKAVWLRDRWQEELTPLPPTLRVDIGINIHPELHQSVNVPVAQDSLLLMPKTAPDPTYRWRIVTMINPEVNDFVTGFVYAALNEQGELLLPVDENAIGINHRRLTPVLPRNVFLSATWQLVAYSFLALLILLTAIHQYRKSA